MAMSPIVIEEGGARSSSTRQVEEAVGGRGREGGGDKGGKEARDNGLEGSGGSGGGERGDRILTDTSGGKRRNEDGSATGREPGVHHREPS